MNEQNDPFLQALDRYAAAVGDKDVEGFLSIYGEDVHIFDVWDTWSLQGKAAWRDVVADWFSSPEKLVVTIDEARSTAGADLVVGHAFIRYAAVSPDGRELRSVGNRLTQVLQKTASSWTVSHEHSSVPIDHSSTRAIFRRATAA